MGQRQGAERRRQAVGGGAHYRRHVARPARGGKAGIHRGLRGREGQPVHHVLSLAVVQKLSTMYIMREYIGFALSTWYVYALD